MQARPATDQLTPRRKQRQETTSLTSPNRTLRYIHAPLRTSQTQNEAEGMGGCTSTLLGAACSQAASPEPKLAGHCGRPGPHTTCDPPCPGRTMEMGCKGGLEPSSNVVVEEGNGPGVMAQQPPAQGQRAIQVVRERMLLFRQEATRLPPPGPKQERCWPWSWDPTQSTKLTVDCH
jgi:hypothetical protein